MRFKGYKYKFRINASHYNAGQGFPGGRADTAHSHTFEVTLYVEGAGFTSFDEAEKLVGHKINAYSGRLLNDIPPFDTTDPTLENIGHCLFAEITQYISDKGFKLFQLDISETPYRVFSVKETDHAPDRMTKLLSMMKLIRPGVSFEENKPGFTPAPAHSSPQGSPVQQESPAKQASPAQQGSPVQQKTPAEKPPAHIPAKNARLAFLLSLAVIFIAGFALMLAVKLSGYYPLGFDVHGHLFKSDLIYSEIAQGNPYPLYTEYWYNGLQPYRYWPPATYYFMALLQLLAGGDVMGAYLGFIWASFFIGGLGWLLFAQRLGRPFLGIFAAAVWFFLPDNLRVFFGEGNMPRMFITMLLPLLFYTIWQLVAYRREKMALPLVGLMLVCVLGHLMISAMIGVGTFVFLLIFSLTNHRWRESVYAILIMLMSFAVAGVWVFPSLVGGITSMGADGTSALMASLASPLSRSLNPFLRLSGNVTELYLGLSVALAALVGLFLSNRKSLPGFASMLIVIAGTTTLVTPLLQTLPLSELFWVRRFMPVAYAMFLIALLEWKQLKRPILIALCAVIAIDCAPSMMLSSYNEKMGYGIYATAEVIPQSMDEYLLGEAKALTQQRTSLMDLSVWGPMPSYAYGTLEEKTPYVFGWAWQGASTASNIVGLNEALENASYRYLFDRHLELGADTVLFHKGLVTDINKLYEAANEVGYRLVRETDEAMLFAYPVEGGFGVVSEYKGLAVGSSAGLVPLVLPYFHKGEHAHIDDYTPDELAAYDKLYLSGTFYKNRENAEAILGELAERGVEIYIDMSNIPADPVTRRMTFMGISAQPISFNDRFDQLITEGGIVRPEEFHEEEAAWNTVYLNGLDTTLGYAWFEEEAIAFAGRGESENITFIGFSLLYHASRTGDEGVYVLLEGLLALEDAALPERQIVPVDIVYEGNKITITTQHDNVNTTIAYQDIFRSDSPIRSADNLLVVDSGTTVITFTYPYLWQGLAVTLFGAAIEIVLLKKLIKRKR